ncbi:MAG: amidohydrolase, partial [Rhodothermales bacterium]
GGKILRDEDGEPTGIFIDAAMSLLSEHVPEADEAHRAEALRRVLEETARLGLTGVHDAGISMDDINLYRTAIDEDRFDLRLYGMIGGVGSTLDTMCESGPILSYGGRLSVRSVKLYIDGALGSRGAALLEPYADDPSNTGLLRKAPDAFTEEVKSVLRCGFQANTHAIGDRGNRVALQAYEEAIGELGPGPGRHRIEHAQIVHPDDFVRFHELHVIASMQPTHATSDMYWAGDRVGEARLAGAYSWRTFLDNGVALTFGSDFPVEAVNPLLGFHAAVTRQDAAGWPDGGWLPEQRVTRDEALRAFTIGAAYAAFQEDEVGSLEAGKYADFVVLSKNIMTIPPSEILETDVLATYLGGRRIYGSAHP